MSDLKGDATAPALGVSLNAQFAAGRQVVFQTHVPQDVSLVELNNLLDTMNAAVDRAEAYYAQEQARKQLEVETNAMLNIARRLREVENNMQVKAMADNRRNPKPSPQDEVQKKQALDTLEESKKRVDLCNGHLQDLIKKAGNRDGAASSTDH